MPESEREMEARDQAPEPMAERGYERGPERGVAGNGMHEYWTRFEAIQAQFIEEPRSAVQSAQKLVEEAVDRMMEGLRHTKSGDKADTEELRVTMKRYRDVLHQIVGEPTAPAAATSPTPSAARRDLPASGEEYSPTTPTPSAARRDLPASGEESRTAPPPSEPTRRA
jgi:hypothetical protein